jgi:hypothetical protein
LTLRTGLGIAAKTANGDSKTMCEIDDKNQIEEQFISSFHRSSGGRVQKITVGERLELENLELFDPVTQEKTDLPSAIIHKQHE